jgi:hypothetical protein
MQGTPHWTPPESTRLKVSACRATACGGWCFL